MPQYRGRPRAAWASQWSSDSHQSCWLPDRLDNPHSVWPTIAESVQLSCADEKQQAGAPRGAEHDLTVEDAHELLVPPDSTRLVNHLQTEGLSSTLPNRVTQEPMPAAESDDEAETEVFVGASTSSLEIAGGVYTPTSDDEVNSESDESLWNGLADSFRQGPQVAAEQPRVDGTDGPAALWSADVEPDVAFLAQETTKDGCTVAQRDQQWSAVAPKRTVPTTGDRASCIADARVEVRTRPDASAHAASQGARRARADGEADENAPTAGGATGASQPSVVDLIIAVLQEVSRNLSVVLARVTRLEEMQLGSTMEEHHAPHDVFVVTEGEGREQPPDSLHQRYPLPPSH